MGQGISNVGDELAVEGRAGGMIDAFNRLRVSNPLTLFDSKQIHDNKPLFWDDQEVSGSGTSSTYNATEASSTIAVSNLTAGKRVRQTKQRFNYQPGKSQLVLFTGNAISMDTGITKEVGYFDDNDGLFFRITGTDVAVVVRSSTSGSPVDTVISRSDWNGDKLDGYGPSRKVLDISKTQIGFIDFEWLGVGTVRFGWFLDGVPTVVHSVNNSNTLPVVYMSTPNLPCRYSIENDGTGPASEFDQICCTVITEGGAQHRGIDKYESTGTTAIQCNTIGTKYVICGIRLKSTALDAQIDITSISAMAGTSDDYEWELLLNPTLAASVTFNDVANSSIQFAVGEGSNPSTSTVTGGTRLGGGYVKGGSNSGDVKGTDTPELRLGSLIDGTPDEIYLVATPITANADIYGGINWQEGS